MKSGKKLSQEEQSARFIESARELGCDESPGAFEAAVKKVARHKPVEEKIAELDTLKAKPTTSS